MASIKWLPDAISDIKRLHTFLESKDSEAASRAAACILEGVNILKSSPRIGRPMPDETGRRELSTAFGAGAYVLRYMIEDDNTVVIIRVWHSREDRV
jgi:plasmid stabilization system protein ParE